MKKCHFCIFHMLPSVSKIIPGNLNNIGVLPKGVLINLLAHNFLHAVIPLCMHVAHMFFTLHAICQTLTHHYLSSNGLTTVLKLIEWKIRYLLLNFNIESIIVKFRLRQWRYHQQKDYWCRIMPWLCTIYLQTKWQFRSSKHNRCHRLFFLNSWRSHVVSRSTLVILWSKFQLLDTLLLLSFHHMVDGVVKVVLRIISSIWGGDSYRNPNDFN